MTKGFLNASFGQYVMPKTYFRLIAETIAEEPYSIGFIRFRNLVQLRQQGREGKVKALAIKTDEQSPGVLPSRETFDSGTYPICRAYYLCIDRKNARRLAREFFDFCRNKNPRAK